MTDIRTLGPMLFVGLVAVAVDVRTAEAQKPERRREARVSGAGGTLRAGWQLLSQDGCRFAVPVSWRAAPDESLMVAPDGAGSLSLRTVRIPTWSIHKAQIKAAFGHLKVVHEDSDRRFWFEFGDEKRITHYIAVHEGPSACVGLLEIHATAAPIAQDTTNRIIDSIGPATTVP
jgi:hypothetical protein